MSGAGEAPRPGGAGATGGADPAMDDILASIRRILNEDEVAEGAAAEAAARAGLPPAEFEPLDLTEAMLVAAPPAAVAAPMTADEIDALMNGPAPAAAPPPAPPMTADEIEALMNGPPPAPPPTPTQGAPMPVPAAPVLSVALPVAAVRYDPPPALADFPRVEALVAPAVAAAATASLGQLLRSVAAERNAPVHRGGPSIEDVVREEVRPLLAAWLDQHLPPLVERLVRVEIERVIGRALP